MVVALALTSALAAQAQDSLSPERRTGQAARVPITEGDITALGIQLRYVDIDGDFETSTPTSWPRAFNSGVGLTVDLGLLHDLGDDFRLGPAFSAGIDFFHGNDAVPFSETVPLTVDMGSLLTVRVLAGVAFRKTFGPVFLELRGGLGVDFYPDMSGTVTVTGPPPVVTTGVEIIDLSFAFAWEVRLTFGARIAQGVNIALSFGYEANGNPKDASAIKPFVPSFDVRGLNGFVLSLGVSLDL
jgi:hypothetical protein